ncbi:E3 ubiquitin-protein ligase HUWE1 [Echinococcus granulosus]|nr:E3 ubiquitin-protein ligase HUWE1 [Echinococcus granulosus]
MKIDRKKIANRCGYDQNECFLLAKRLAGCSDEDFLKELRKIKVWNYGKCELGLWADILDRLDAILEDVTTKVGTWTLKVDAPGNEHLVKDVVTVLEFTSHLIEHSIYRCLYGSWSHILALFATSNMDILLAVLGLAYNFSKRSNYFSRLDPNNRSLVLERLVSIAESWGGAENGFDIASCCRMDHYPPSAGKVIFEYYPESEFDGQPGSLSRPLVIEEYFKDCNKSPSEVMEELLKIHPVPPSKQTALFARIRSAVYFSDPEKRLKCIKARLQAISTLCYTFEFDDRLIYFGLVEELVDVLQLPDGEVMSIKACALRTMTAIFNLQRLNVNLVTILESTGMANFHGALPTRIRRWIQGLVDGTCDASGGSVNQQYTIALLSFLYHLAAFEQNLSSGNGHNMSVRTMNSSGILDSMLQLIAWHVPRNDCLSYVTRAVRVTDQILSSIISNRQLVLDRLVDRLDYEAELVLHPPPELAKAGSSSSQTSPLGVLNTQRSGLMKSMLNLLKRLCLEADWYEHMRTAMSGNLPLVLRKIYSNRVFHATPHLVLFAMETITNYIYTYPSSISHMQDKGVTSDILSALTENPLPQSRDFLVHLPSILRTLALNPRGRTALCSSGVLQKYVETLVSPEYLPTMRAKRLRDFLSQISYNLSIAASNVGQNNPTNNLTASQMSVSLHELMRTHSDIRGIIFNSILNCFTKIVDMGKTPASLIPATSIDNTPPGMSGGSGANSNIAGSTAAVAGTSTRSSSDIHPPVRVRHRAGSPDDDEDVDVDVDVVVEEDDEVEEEGAYLDAEVEDVNMLLSGSDGAGSDVDNPHHAISISVLATPTSPEHPSISGGSSTLTTTAIPTAVATVPTAVATPMDVDEEEGSQSISDFILNVSKFMERLHSFFMHVNDLTSYQLHSRAGVQVLCDLLLMPGLPFDFPVSFSCATFCKSVDQLLSYMSVEDVVEPILETLEKSIQRAKYLRAGLVTAMGTTSMHQSGSSGAPTSVLLAEFNAGRTQLLHELVCISSIICVVVQIVNHLKPEMRGIFGNLWTGKEFLRDLGELYHEVLWEATILLSSICDEQEQSSSITTTTSATTVSKTTNTATTGNTGTSGSSSGCGDVCGALPDPVEKSLFPPFVETLSIFKIISPLRNNSETPSDAHHVLYVSSFIINSVNELCTTLTRFCLLFPQTPRRFIMQFSNPPPQDALTASARSAILGHVALFMADRLLWQPPTPPPPLRIVDALRYSAFQLIHLFLFGTSTNRMPSVIMLKTFSMLGGIGFLFESFNDFVANAMALPSDKKIVGKVIEGWLACADRLTDVSTLKTEVQRVSETDFIGFDLDKYSNYLHRRILEPLCLICQPGFIEYLTNKGVEHLLSILKNVVPAIFAPASEVASSLVSSDQSRTQFSTPTTSTGEGREEQTGVDTTEMDTISDILSPSSIGVLEELGFTMADFLNAFGMESTMNQIRDLLNKRPSAKLHPPLSFEASRQWSVFLKEKLFNACLQIAKLHDGDEVLQQIADVLLSNKDESHCVFELVRIITDDAADHIYAAAPLIPPKYPSTDVEVAMHLLALFFTRCRFVCVRAFNRHRLPNLLCHLLTGSLWPSVSSPSRRSKLLTLAALLLEQYIHMTAALRLRQRHIRLYADRHSWAWFDHIAKQWHAYCPEEFRLADRAFHDGVYRFTYEDRKTNVVEFYPLLLSSNERTSTRPIALMPKLPSFNTESEVPSVSEVQPNLTDYERDILRDEKEVPLEPLSSTQRCDLCLALIEQFKDGELDARCTDAFLRLLLRLSASSFDDVDTLLGGDVLCILFNFPHEARIALQYSAFVGHLIRQLFDDKASLTANMRQVIGQFFRGGSPLLQWCYRDLFYTLSVLIPLMAKNEEVAMSLFKELSVIDITEESLKDGIPPKAFLLSLDPAVDDPKAFPVELTDRQKCIITILINHIVQDSGCLDTSGEDSASTATNGVNVDIKSDVPPVKSSSTRTRLAKSDYLRYLNDLVMASRGVVEFVAKFNVTDHQTFLNYLLNQEFRDSLSMDLTILLLETILFSSSSATQNAIIVEFKTSLKYLLASGSSVHTNLSISTSSSDGFGKNQRIISHMRFLEYILALPYPLQGTIIRHLYKRQIPADVAKLIAMVHCNVSNSAAALNVVVKVLDDLSNLDRQILRRITQLEQQSKRVSAPVAENHVSVVTTVSDSMMHTAAETTQPVASALAPSIVGIGDSVHSAPAAAMATATPAGSRQQQRQPATPNRQHVTAEGDTWALAEDASEMEDTTVEDSNAILILDEVVVDPRTGGGSGGAGSRSNGEDEDNTDDARRIDDSYVEEGEDGDSYHDLEDGEGDEDDEDDGEDGEEEDDDEDDGGDDADTTDEIDEEDERGPFGDHSMDQEVDVDDLVEAQSTDNGSSNQHNNMMITLVNEVFNAVDSTIDSIGGGVGVGGGIRGSQNHRRLGGDIERGLILHFTSFGGNDGVTNWGSSTHHPIVSGDRLYDLSTGSRTNIDFPPPQHGSIFLNDSHVVGGSSGGGSVSGLNHAIRHPIISLPSQNPFIQVSEGSASAGLRSVSGGVNDNTTTISLRSLRAHPSSRRDSNAISSAVLTFYPQSHRSGGGGGYARITGNQTTTPILVRTNLGSSVQPSTYLQAAQSSLLVGQGSMQYNAFVYDNPNSMRSNRRRTTPQATASGLSQRRPAELSELEGDKLIWEMLTDFWEFQCCTVTESLRLAGCSFGVTTGVTAPPSLFFNTLNTYRHFVELALILCGQEIMDMIMIARHEVGVVAVRRRNEEYAHRLAEYRQEMAQRHQQEQTRTEALGSDHGAAVVDEFVESASSPLDRPGTTPRPDVIDSDIDSIHDEGESAPLFPALLNSPNSPSNRRATDEGEATTAVVTESFTSTSATTSAVEIVEPPASSTSVVSAPEAQAQESTPQLPQIRVPVTDEEIIASMVSEGMDPSFLDALPEEMRRELMTEHQRTVRLRSQLSSMQNTVPDHVDEAFLTSLPPNIQEEVLAQVRQTAVASGAEAGTPVVAANGSTAQADGSNNNNSSFLASLPPALRREILTDMEDFQIDLLPTEMQHEARRLRRHMVEQTARQESRSQNHRSQNQIRSLPSRIFPAFFGPVTTPDSSEAQWRVNRNIQARGGSNLSPASTLFGLQSLFTSTHTPRGQGGSRSLLDHEGLTCIIALIITCSTSPSLRRNTFPTIKRLLQNLCFHQPTRIWLISTLVQILKQLSEAPLSLSASAMAPSSANSIFGAGFEAALGCWVRNLQPLANGLFVVHPQAANYVCFIVLDVLADLAQSSATQFFPLTLDSSVISAGDYEPADIRTDFWEVLTRLCRGIGPSSSSSPRKSLSISPARLRSTATAAPNRSRGSDSMDITTPPVDYFSHLVGLLRHPVVTSRPVLQEKLLFLLVRVVDEFFRANEPPKHGNLPRRRNGVVVGSRDLGAFSPDETAVGTQPSTAASASAAAEPGSSSTTATSLIAPLSPSVIQSLCDFVMARNSTEQSRTLATWLIILMSRANSSTRERFFQVLAIGAGELAQVIEGQLSAVIDEINQLSPDSRRRRHQRGIGGNSAGGGGSGDGPSTSSGSGLQHSASMTRLPDRFGTPGTSVFVGGPSTSLAPPPPAPTGGELELASLQPLLTSRSQQSRFCRILRLMLHLSFPPDVSMQSVEALSSLWRRLSMTLDCLEETSDANTVLLFQPLVECLCLAHASPSQTTCVNAFHSPFSGLLRRGVIGGGLASWTGIDLPISLNSGFSTEDQNIILFDGFPEIPSTAETVAAASPQIDLTRPMSPPDWTMTDTTESAEKASTSWDVNSLSSNTNLIAWFAEKHRVGLNHILRHYVGNISESAFTVFLSQPKCLDFDVKRRFFRQRFQSLRARSPQPRSEEEPLVVSRERIFEDTFTRLHSRGADVWKHKFVIRFQNEEGQDAGGLLREWYLLMSREIFNPNYCLFRVSPSDRVTYTINPASFINSNHLSYFRFVGRFIAKAIYDNKLLECYFTRSFYKHILGRRVRFTDLESEDYDFYKGLEYLLTHHVSELNYEITFCTEINEFGKNETRDLVENGRNIVVTEANKHEYVRLVCQERMTGAIRQQLGAFLEGFYSIIPKSLINIFNEQELELLISGLPNIDIDDLRANTTYSKYQPTSPQVEWFWQALESFDQEDRARFLQFLTGTSRVPLGGFANLEGMHGPTKFQICRAAVSSTNHLPSAHTCFNTLELPPYESYEQLRKRLLTAIRECCEGYGMA